MKKVYKSNSYFCKKVFVPSFFCLSLIGSTTAIVASTNLNLKSTITNNLTSLQDSNDSSKNVSESITGFDKYNLLNSTNSIAPIVTTQGSIGTTLDNKSMTLTTFDGILVWNKIFANDSLIKNFYSKTYSKNNIDDLLIKNYIYLPNVDVIAVLLGTSDNKNQSLFGINMGTGTLYNPLSVSNDANIVKINDGIKYLYLNSKGDIIATKGNVYNDYVNSQYISMNNSIGISILPIVIPKDTAQNSSDYLLTIVKGQKNVNFAIFLSSSLNNGNNSFPKNSRSVYAVAVDNYLKPIFINSNTKVLTTFGSYKAEDNNNSTVDLDKILTYQPTSFNANNNSKDFFVVISGENSSISKLNYTYSSKNLIKTWTYSGDEQIYNFFSFNNKSNKIYLGNKKSAKGCVTGYVNLASSSSNFTSLEIDNSNWNSTTHFFTKTTKEIPIISDSKLSYSDPYIVLKEEGEPVAKYFVNNNDIQNKPLNFKSYNDPVSIFKTSYKSSLSGLASSVPDTNLVGSLKFINNSNDSSFNPTVKVVDKKVDDNNGILNFNYQVTYQNWYSTGTNYTFKIATSISGFYAKSNVVFNWITGLTGDVNNDNKWKNILNLKASKYSYDVTAQDVVNNFATLTAKDSSLKNISLTSNMVTLNADPSGYSLTVTINIGKNTSFPNGVQTVYTQKYDGFKTISGYDFKVSDKSAENLNSIYPSQLTLSIFLKNYVTLGSKWSKSDSDWDFKVIPDNLKGTASITLTYKGKNADFPIGKDKTIVNNQTFTGFNSVPKQFKSGLLINEYNGILSPSDLWNDYLKNPSTSVLFSSLKFPYINNNNDLNITCSNQNSTDKDGYLKLQVSIKTGTNTSLYIPNDGQFVYDEKAQNIFKNENLDTFTIDWKINKVEQKFDWKDNQGNIVNNDSNSIQIDLTNNSYSGINKTMYADQVSIEAINNLYYQTGCIVNQTKYSNVLQGTLTIVLNLKVQGTQDSTTGTTQTKTILISSFKVPLLSSTTKILLTFGGVLGFFIIIVVILLLMYTKRKALNYKYRKINPKNIKKIKNK